MSAHQYIMISLSLYINSYPLFFRFLQGVEESFSLCSRQRLFGGPRYHFCLHGRGIRIGVCLSEDSRVKHVYLIHEQDEVSLLILDLAGLQIEEITVASNSLYRLAISVQCLC
jgi:hypothetical protein